MSKLWQKETETERSVEKFTVGNDRELDHQLAAFDVLGSLAHTRMLQSIGLMDSQDLEQVQTGLKQIFQEVQEGKFSIEENVEDVHSQVELLLTRRIGDAGKKIHSGRSRNDQVLVDLKLFFRSEIQKLVRNTDILFTQLIAQSEEHNEKLLPAIRICRLQCLHPLDYGLEPMLKAWPMIWS
jgi:argininosuccinate lyase